eukprot:TRINITY_DN5824_c0_g2_i1.p1 TRINITY_DN5824_c0_g2~~TRINITY_DN5824_c0_g2_i1.p1  ORF type:complete len:107 (-),score=21.14 TRINITY_DN5824_c0_g2_i1:27-347(-)
MALVLTLASRRCKRIRSRSCVYHRSTLVSPSISLVRYRGGTGRVRNAINARLEKEAIAHEKNVEKAKAHQQRMFELKKIAIEKKLEREEKHEELLKKHQKNKNRKS